MVTTRSVIGSTPVADTAFMVSWMRARDPTLSKDHWGHLWATDVAKEIGSAYAQVTGQLNARAVCLRHRFFAETALQFERTHPDMALVNIGSGYTSYPMLLGPQHISIEVDLPAVIEFRQHEIAKFVSAGRMPARNIHYVALDLESGALEHTLHHTFHTIVASRPTLVIMEGLLYYLTRQTVDRLFAALATRLSPGDRIATIAWASSLQETAKFQAIDQYFQQRLGRTPHQYTFLDASYFQSRRGLRFVEEINSPTVESRYADAQLLEPGSYLDERMFVLERA